ncbi:hypothetical protein [Streptomyces sp. NPDC059781]|uniref:hypothetical protein n=1 Tax=Streptomyces sp. NPDC059781 TaxID=3346943 RepID=UPI00366508C4
MPVTWAALILLPLAPSLLPEQWHHYVYSPASVGLWMPTMVVAPVVVCAVLRRRLRTGGR